MAANAVCKQLRDLSHKIGPTLQPVFVSKKLGQDLRPKEIKPSIVNKQCIVLWCKATRTRSLEVLPIQET